MVHKIKRTELLPDLNKCFVELIEKNIENRRQSIIYLSNANTITLNGRGLKVKTYDDVLKVYRDDEVKHIIDINTIIAVTTK